MPFKFKRVSQAVTVFLCAWLLLPPAWARQEDGQVGIAPADPPGIRLVVVEGDQARNVIQQIPARPLTVRVEDNAGRPVPGAMVLFTAPATGASGVFADGSSSLAAVTDQAGLAIVRDYHPNALEGAYRIQVSAEFEGQTAATIIRQTNIAPGGGNGRLIAILAIVGAAVGAVFAARSGGNDEEPAPTPRPAITFGDGAVGAP